MPDSSVAATAQSMKASSPIEPLPTDLARIVTHIQPVLLLSAYYLRFPSLVSDPVASLLVGLIPLTIVQATYCVVCLPPTGTTTGAVKRTQKGKRRRMDSQLRMWWCAPNLYTPLVDCMANFCLTAADPLPRPHPPLNSPPLCSPSPIRRAPDNSPPTHAPIIRSPSTASHFSACLRSRRRFP